MAEKKNCIYQDDEASCDEVITGGIHAYNPDVDVLSLENVWKMIENETRGHYELQKVDGSKNIERERSIFKDIHFGGVSPSITEETGRKILDKLDELNRKLDLIFGSHALINGRFIDISKFGDDGK